MSDREKRPQYRHETSPPRTESCDEELPQPSGWKYRTRSIGPLRLPYYASPVAQLIIVAIVCFLCPGMFNALGGIGGGGQVDTTVANDANIALYATFAVIGFFSGTFTNKLGIKFALSFGGLGYCIYIASFLCYSHTQNKGFSIFAGALLGVCAGMLWCAQGIIMMSYPEERLKGRYISGFWMIFNLGGVIGSLIPLGQNIHVTTQRTVTDGTYIGFMVLTFCGALLAWCLVSSKDVVRDDGSRVILMKHPTWSSEIYGLWETLLSEPFIVLLFPMFWSSNWFYTYQFNDYNHARFNTRTAALNNVLYWSSQIFGSLIFGYCLDLEQFRRSTRARGLWVALFALTMAIWGGGYAFQKGYTRADVTAAEANPTDPNYAWVALDWTSSGYIGPMFLYLFYGAYDAAWQTSVYWLMGALTNNSRKLANYAGWYKGIQSAGAAVMWNNDRLGTPYSSMFGSTWGLLAGSLVVALPLVLTKVRDHVPIEEDLRLSDETYAEVAPREAEGSVTRDKIEEG